jgi:hypothetical protein
MKGTLQKNTIQLHLYESMKAKDLIDGGSGFYRR